MGGRNGDLYHMLFPIFGIPQCPISMFDCRRTRTSHWRRGLKGPRVETWGTYETRMVDPLGIPCMGSLV